MARGVGVALVAICGIMACIALGLGVSGAFGGDAGGIQDTDTGAAREFVESAGGLDGVGGDTALRLIDFWRFLPWALMLVLAGGALLFVIYWFGKGFM